MSDFFTEEQEELRKLARRVAIEKVRPRAAACDRTGEFPWDLIKSFRRGWVLRLLHRRKIRRHRRRCH